MVNNMKFDNRIRYNIWRNEKEAKNNYTSILEKDIMDCIDSYLSSVNYQEEYARRCLLNEDYMNYIVPLLPSFMSKYANLIYGIEIKRVIDRDKLNQDNYIIFIHCDVEFIISYFFSQELFKYKYNEIIFIIDSNYNNHTKIVIENSFIIIWNISMESTEVWVPSFRQLQGIDTIYLNKDGSDEIINILPIIPEVFGKNCTIYMMKVHNRSPILEDSYYKMSIKENNFNFYTVLFIGFLFTEKTRKKIGLPVYSDVILPESSEELALFFKLNICNNSYGLNQIEIFNENKEQWIKAYQYAVYTENSINQALIIDNKLSKKDRLMLVKYAKEDEIHYYMPK